MSGPRHTVEVTVSGGQLVPVEPAGTFPDHDHVLDTFDTPSVRLVRELVDTGLARPMQSDTGWLSWQVRFDSDAAQRARRKFANVFLTPSGCWKKTRTQPRGLADFRRWVAQVTDGRTARE